VFRRRSSDTSELLDQDPAAADGTADGEQTRPARSSVTPPKGAPTPKRSEAQSGRRQPYQAPTDRKAAAQQSRERGRDDRVRRTQALQRGEQWALPRKDQGPVRALARDVVDSRRGIGEYYMLMVLVLIILLVLPGNATKLIADAVVVGLLVIILVEGWFIGNKVKKLAAERFPGQSTQGVLLYTTMRGISLRRMRVPKPRVSRGDKI
jgi:Protein of unknown function (DUF3043)